MIRMEPGTGLFESTQIDQSANINIEFCPLEDVNFLTDFYLVYIFRLVFDIFVDGNYDLPFSLVTK